MSRASETLNEVKRLYVIHLFDTFYFLDGFDNTSARTLCPSRITYACPTLTGPNCRMVY